MHIWMEYVRIYIYIYFICGTWTQYITSAEYCDLSWFINISAGFCLVYLCFVFFLEYIYIYIYIITLHIYICIYIYIYYCHYYYILLYIYIYLHTYIFVYNIYIYIMNFQSRCEFGCLERGTIGGYGFEVMVRYDGTVLGSWYGAVVRFSGTVLGSWHDIMIRYDYDISFLIHSAIWWYCIGVVQCYLVQCGGMVRLNVGMVNWCDTVVRWVVCVAGWDAGAVRCFCDVLVRHAGEIRCWYAMVM